MIQSHRKVHVWAWFAVTAFVGIVFALWLAERLQGGP
jgi:hypothetical protein